MISKYPATLRVLETADMAFAEQVYATSRAEEMSSSGWPPEHIAAFLSMQFKAQHTYYQEHYRGADFFIVELDGQRIGRLYLYWGSTTLTLIDIALLPQYQGQGIGNALLQQQLQRADERGLEVELSVEAYNRAQHLYVRAGFHVINESGVYLRMRREARDSSPRMAS